jgi:hypothetical protein
VTLSRQEKQFLLILTGIGGIALFARMAKARSGQVVVHEDEITVTPLVVDDAVRAEAILTARVRRAHELLAIDLDEMVPTRRPSLVELSEIRSTMDALRAAGRSGDANFLRDMVDEANRLKGAASA